MKTSCYIASISSFLLLFACSSDPSDSQSDSPMSKTDVQGGKADQGIDYCEVFNWYGDGECDEFCLLPDPDCTTVCEPLEKHIVECVNGYVIQSYGTFDPEPGGPDCAPPQHIIDEGLGYCTHEYELEYIRNNLVCKDLSEAPDWCTEPMEDFLVRWYPCQDQLAIPKPEDFCSEPNATSVCEPLEMFVIECVYDYVADGFFDPEPGRPDCEPPQSAIDEGLDYCTDDEQLEYFRTYIVCKDLPEAPDWCTEPIEDFLARLNPCPQQFAIPRPEDFCP